MENSSRVYSNSSRHVNTLINESSFHSFFTKYIYDFFALYGAYSDKWLLIDNLDINELQKDDKWLILKEILKEFQITESNEILVCVGSFVTRSRIYYQETEYYTEEVPIDYPNIQYQTFKNIETKDIYMAYTDKYIQSRLDEENMYFKRFNTPSEYCQYYRRCLVSELMDKYIILNPSNSTKIENGFEDVQKDFFTTAIEKGQPKAKQLVLTKYPKNIF